MGEGGRGGKLGCRGWEAVVLAVEGLAGLRHLNADTRLTPLLADPAAFPLSDHLDLSGLADEPGLAAAAGPLLRRRHANTLARLDLRSLSLSLYSEE